jgi:hypothetical protein
MVLDNPERVALVISTINIRIRHMYFVFHCISKR